MKKYYNLKDEQFKLEKGTIKELKDYQGRVDCYLYQDEDNKAWYMSFTKGWIDHKGRCDYGVYISPLMKLTTEECAHICGYWE